ncbi:hypothetical protein GQ53DRAFT_833471 [Thozetella sp. PMI_491]|nr:hypothetical protein GQ53DRAFT_833471 [Thozetella sp. PMI_491]
MDFVLLRRGLDAMSTPDEISQLNSTDLSTLEPTVWWVNLTFIVLVFVVLFLRLFARIWFTGKIFADDVLIIFAAGSLLVASVAAIVGTNYGLGRHVVNIPPPVDNILNSVKRCIQLMFVANISYACATVFTKMSIITSYLRMFPHHILRRVLFVTAVVVIGLGISAIFATIFQCTPVHAAWDFDEPGYCYTFVYFLYSNSAINMATDFVLCLSPLPIFWGLKLPLKQKCLVSFLFLIGFFACIASIIRLTYLHNLDGLDVTYNLVPSLNWTVIECSLGIICVSVPPTRPLLTYAQTILSKPPFSLLSRSRKSKSGAEKTETEPRSRMKTAEEYEIEMDRALLQFELLGSSNRKSTTNLSTVEQAAPEEQSDTNIDLEAAIGVAR